MKKLLILFLISFISCTGSLKKKSDNENLVEKRILQYIDAQALGMLDMKNVKIEEITKLNDTTYVAIRIFENPAVDREMRIPAKYVFPLTMDSVKYSEDIKVEMKSEGEWVDMDF